jgi:hypothetical protein
MPRISGVFSWKKFSAEAILQVLVGGEQRLNESP